MSASGVELVAVDGQRLRLGSWRGDPHVGYLAPSGDGEAIGGSTLRAAVTHLADAGYDEIITGAVPEGEAGPFVDAGFAVRERLWLLVHDLAGVGRPRRGSSRRARRGDRPGVLALDHLAFDPFWRLDDGGLDDSLDATPVARFRVSTWPGEVVPPPKDAAAGRAGSGAAAPAAAAVGAPPSGGLTGYAICGCGGDRGYVQRLAVHPANRGRGVAESLLADGLRWLVRRGARSALVNTQEGNDRALRLYRRVGFVPAPHGLVVLHTATRA